MKDNISTKVPVGRRAVIARIDRYLQQHGQHSCASYPGSRAQSAVGDYYVICVEGEVIERALNLEAYARRINVLAKHEELA